MPVYQMNIGGKEYTVEVPNPHARPVQAIVNGETVEVFVEESGAGVSVAAAPVPVIVSNAPVVSAAPVAISAPGRVSAPLPGTVLSVDVQVGARVERGQQLCVLEAMKMNNPLRATSGGTVTQVFISAGQQVQHGDLLVVIE